MRIVPPFLRPSTPSFETSTNNPLSAYRLSPAILDCPGFLPENAALSPPAAMASQLRLQHHLRDLVSLHKNLPLAVNNHGTAAKLVYSVIADGVDADNR